MSFDRVSAETERAASMSVAGGSIFWGLYWIPLRHLNGLGIEGVWTGTLVYGLCSILLLPAFVWRLRNRRLPFGRLALGGFLLGGALTCYSVSLLLTDVVRAMLLFYMTPVWGTLLGIAFLGEPLRLGRVLALASGLAGLMIVLKADIKLPVPSNLGDWLGLMGGIFWAWGSLMLFRLRKVGTFDHTFAWIVGTLATSLLLTVIFGRDIGAPPTVGAAGTALGFSILMATFVVFPMCLLTLWGCRYLTPGRVGLLLLGEVLAGVTSAAILTDETFGAREALGAILVLGAALLEPLGARRSRALVDAGVG